MSSTKFIQLRTPFLQRLMIQHSQIILVISIDRDFLREMLLFCIVAVPNAIQVMIIRLEELHTVGIINMIKSIVYDCLFTIDSETSSLSLTKTGRHVSLNSNLILKIYDLYTRKVFIVQLFVLK